MPGREWKSLALIDLRVIEDAKLNGIHVQLTGQFVHRRFDRIKAWYSARAAHIGPAADVSPGAAKGHPQIGHTVLECRAFAAAFMMSIEDRPCVDVIVLQRNQLAFRCRSQADALLCARPMPN